MAETKAFTPFPDQPGGLRNTTTMTIQTNHASKIVNGRPSREDSHSIVGLLEFGHRMKQIWFSAEANDPYADWFLLQIEEEIQKVKKDIAEKQQQLKGLIAGMEGFNINMAESNQPIQIELSFKTPYGYIGAYLVHDFDVLIRMIFTARHIGLLDNTAARSLILGAGTGIRRLFSLSNRWKFTGVTRDDLKENNLNAQRAIEEFGACPEDILSEKKRAKVSPQIRKRQVLAASNDDSLNNPAEVTESDDETAVAAVG